MSVTGSNLSLHLIASDVELAIAVGVAVDGYVCKSGYYNRPKCSLKLLPFLYTNITIVFLCLVEFLSFSIEYFL